MDAVCRRLTRCCAPDSVGIFSTIYFVFSGPWKRVHSGYHIFTFGSMVESTGTDWICICESEFVEGKSEKSRNYMYICHVAEFVGRWLVGAVCWKAQVVVL